MSRLTLDHAHHRLRNRTLALRDKVIDLATDLEAQFGADDDRTIFAQNAYCELQEIANTLEGKPARKRRVPPPPAPTTVRKGGLP